MFKTILLLILFFFNTGVLSIENKILFKINNEIVTTVDIYKEVQYLKIINPKINELKKEVKSGMNPRDTKILLAEEIIERFRSKEDAENAKNTFLDRFQKGAKPKDIKTFSISLDDDIAIGNLLKESGLVQSTSEAMRLVKQGAVKINDEKIDDPKLSIGKNQELLVQVGKRRFLKIKT